MTEIRIRIKGKPESEEVYEAAALLFGLVLREAGAEADISLRSMTETEGKELIVPEFMSKRGA